jgi:hypothetical protein
MKLARLGLLCVLSALALAAPSDHRSAHACGWSSSVETMTQQHPDLPFDHFAAGRLGIVQPTYARSYLVVAYRHLQGIGLSTTEQAGARNLWAARVGRPASANRPEAPWVDAKHRHLGTPTDAPIPTGTTQHYAWIDNCLPDAFAKAGATLDARANKYGSKSKEVQAWVARQDAVFARCGGSGAALPPALPTTDPLLRADAAYQDAALAFYAGDHAEAERRFRAIGLDSSSPWRPLAKYVTVRAITRAGMMAGPAPSLPALQRAETEVRALLADPTAREVHGAARRYLQFLRFRTDPSALQRELAVALAGSRLDADFESALDDYTALLDRDPGPLALSARSDDRLSAWIGVMQSTDAKAFDRAEALYKQSRSTVWLVASLAKASPAHGSRLDPLLRDASAVAVSHPGFALARYHRIRLLAARQASSALFQEARTTLASLRPEDGVSARNALLELAVVLAPTLDDLIDHAVTVPAGVYEDGSWGVVQPSAGAVPMLHPASAGLVSSKLPVSRMAEAARSARLPANVRAQVAVAAWTRAVLLGDHKQAKALAPVVSSLNPALRPFVERTVTARGRALQRLALLETLLEASTVSTNVHAWRAGSVAMGTIQSSYDTTWWCGSATAGGNAGNSWQTPGQVSPWDVRFLSPEERRVRDREVRQLEQLGSAPTFLAKEAAAVAELVPNDPRVPKLLHLAVRATRYGCKDAGTTEASRAAFRVLHKKYPSSEWAKQTPYYY